MPLFGTQWRGCMRGSPLTVMQSIRGANQCNTVAKTFSHHESVLHIVNQGNKNGQNLAVTRV
jgi:hypothetical protein